MNVFIAGATGYLGTALAPALLSRGHGVTALARESSARRIDARCRAVVGDALDGRTFGAGIDGCDTFVHLVGTPHPSPRKAALFRSVDLASARESIAAAAAAGVGTSSTSVWRSRRRSWRRIRLRAPKPKTRFARAG